MRLYGLIGYPLGHSFSKKYFSEKFEKEGLYNCQYENFPIVSVDKLKTVLELHPELKGLNVTIPFKEQVLSLLDYTDEIVKKIGACNCIRITGEKLYGYNTDVAGFEYSLKKDLKSFHKNALILGTGGAAKAVRYVLEKLNIENKMVSRKPTGEYFSYDQITSDIISDHLLIINTTPLGMQPHLADYPSIPYGALTARHYLFDCIYNPDKTAFLQKGETQGATIRNGYEMLVFQAEESWKIWNS
ncbi:MAG: shikimate dehydrogenase [Bacteroidetes bacterium]|nr:shikimate dehydrogenase [Bacteroidota bacterium]